jgi:hypothetical protein
MTYDREAAKRYALGQVGKGYQWAYSGPSLFDCSGLTMQAAAAGGLFLPHNSAEQAKVLNAVPVKRGAFGRRKLQVGDIVFYYKPITHCAIVVWVGPGGWTSKVVAATNEERGVELLTTFAYAKPVSFGYIEHT